MLRTSLVLCNRCDGKIRRDPSILALMYTRRPRAEPIRPLAHGKAGIKKKLIGALDVMNAFPLPIGRSGSKMYIRGALSIRANDGDASNILIKREESQANSNKWRPEHLSCVLQTI